MHFNFRTPVNYQAFFSAASYPQVTDLSIVQTNRNSFLSVVDKFPNLRHLAVGDFSNEDCSKLEELGKSLESLKLHRYTGFDSSAFRFIPALINLRELDLFGFRLAESDLRSLHALSKLKKLTLGQCLGPVDEVLLLSQVQELHLAFLSNIEFQFSVMSNLKKLVLERVRVTPLVLSELQELLATTLDELHLKEVLSNTGRFTDLFSNKKVTSI
jgi:hypothetical protein